MGAESNAFTGYDYTGYYAKGRSELFPKLLDVVADVYQHSVFPEAEIEKERGVICGEIDMTEDMPQSRIGYLFLESLYGDQPAGRPILGLKENIHRFDRQAFLEYRNEHYIAEKTVVVVAGDINEATAVKEIEQAFAEIRTGVPVRKQKIETVSGSRVAVLEKPTDQAHIVMGLRGLPLGHPDHAGFALLTGILGQGMSSRLFIRLREEMGAGYYVYASQNSSDDAGEFDIGTGTKPKRVEEILQAIKEEIDRLRTAPVSGEELSKTKEYLVGRLFMGLESSDAVAQWYAGQAVLNQPLKSPEEAERELRAITADDILRLAKDYLVPERFHMAFIGPKAEKGQFENILKGW
jgi:predicted Zn-dependent peptidase